MKEPSGSEPGVSELRTSTLDRATVALQMDIALIADHEFQAHESNDTTAATLARLNTADGVFAEQVGLLLNASQLLLVPNKNRRAA